MTMKATLRTNTANNGMVARFIAFLIFGELKVVDDMSSFEERNRISSTAISAPPTPIPTAVVIVIALDAVVAAADEDTMLDNIVRSIPSVVFKNYQTCFIISKDTQIAERQEREQEEVQCSVYKCNVRQALGLVERHAEEYSHREHIDDVRYRLVSGVHDREHDGRHRYSA